MNDLLKTRLSDLLFETSQEVTTEEMQNAYGIEDEFILIHMLACFRQQR